MALVKKIFSIVWRVFLAIGLLCTTLLAFSVAYIMFAPDTWWKPFYLNYVYPTPIAMPADMQKTLSAPTPTVVVTYAPGQGIMISTGTKIINLNQTNVNKYIRIGITLEFAPKDPTYLTMTAAEKTAFLTTFTADINAKMPLIDDTSITVLATKTFDDLYIATGKEKLRAELMEKINAKLSPDFSVIGVYFTEFVIN
ncbi:MAG TPA: flagellar basal body-associated FliL family protein [Leptolinea sp.]